MKWIRVGAKVPLAQLVKQAKEQRLSEEAIERLKRFQTVHVVLQVDMSGAVLQAQIDTQFNHQLDENKYGDKQ